VLYQLSYPGWLAVTVPPGAVGAPTAAPS
jgi:hypothetical protein